MNVKSTVESIVSQYSEQQVRLEPFISLDPNASEVYEQLEIQKVLFQALDQSIELSISDQEALSEQIEVFQATYEQADRLIEIMKEMYVEH